MGHAKAVRGVKKRLYIPVVILYTFWMEDRQTAARESVAHGDGWEADCSIIAYEKGEFRGRSARLRFHYSTPLTKAPQISHLSRFFTERMRARGVSRSQVRHRTHFS